MELGMNFLSALKQVVDERNLSEDVIISSVEAALASAYRKFREGKLEPEVHIDRTTGVVTIYDLKRVADSPRPGESEISPEEARALGMSDVNVNDMVKVPVKEHPERFGRIAAQTARQVIIQRLKDAERDIIYNEFNDKIGDLITGTIFKSEADQVLVRISERSEAVLTKSECIAGETYTPGEKKKFFLLDVRQTTRGPKILLSRSHPGLLRKLMELQIPEIQGGIVEIKNTVREAGARAKVAVVSNDPAVDPVGACVGNNGARIKNISNELCDEKIDIIIWSEDPLVFIQNALSPAKTLGIEVVPDQERTARVYAPTDQLSLAIGKAGQNVRLAARLTGWRVDICTASGTGESSATLADLFEEKGAEV
ncbi:MAG: transcription termination factor NusA [Pyramidobacter sp.]|nr:transcription termination factor NusA [Pyramidobacter sp.]